MEKYEQPLRLILKANTHKGDNFAEIRPEIDRQKNSIVVELRSSAIQRDRPSPPATSSVDAVWKIMDKKKTVCLCAREGGVG